MCGCLEPVGIHPRTDSKRGDYLGHHKRYAAQGHQLRLSPLLYVEEDRGYITPCWVWQRSINVRHGYGIISLGNGKSGRAHIRFWVERRGPVPDDLELDHLCRVRSCVNPDHLEPVTRAVNTQRGALAVLTPDLVRTIRALYADGVRLADIARRLGLRRGATDAAAKGRTWKNIT